jgi:hypothetical protein
MKTYCNYNDERYEVLSFGSHTLEYMKKHLVLNMMYVDAKDEYGRPTRIDLVLCTEFTQAN